MEKDYILEKLKNGGISEEDFESLPEWVDVTNYEGYYQVSKYGEVRSLDRYIDNRFYQGIILKQYKKKNSSYFKVNLSINNKREHLYIHKLVVLGFSNFKSNNKIHIDHIDNNGSNNNLKNLQILDRQSNITKRWDYYKDLYSTDELYIIKQKKRNNYTVLIKDFYLGSFKTLEIAIEWRDKYLNSNDKSKVIAEYKKNRYYSIHKYISFNKKNNKWFVSYVSPEHTFRAYNFNTEQEALEYRNKYLKENNLEHLIIAF